MVMFMLISLFLMSVKVMPENVDSSHEITVRHCGTPRRSRNQAVGRTKHGQYPWMVTITEDVDDGLNFICGGSILNENWILTAAHCVDFINDTSKYRVYAGLQKLIGLQNRFDPTVQKRKISKIILHDDYDEETHENDIALLKTKKPINIAGSNGYVNGICLPISDTYPQPYATNICQRYGYAQVIGWRLTYEDGQSWYVLKASNVPIFPRGQCNKAYVADPEDEFDEATENIICAGISNKDECQNDSGGPLIQMNNGAATIIGVVSYEPSCGDRYYPGVYTKVSSYKQWIQENVSK